MRLYEISISQIGRVIKELRKRENLSQDDLGEKCGLTRNYLSLVESGKRTVSIKTLERIINSIGCDVVIAINKEK